jgi:antitoxin component of MazEF toxin-antitoxin module
MGKTLEQMSTVRLRREGRALVVCIPSQIQQQLTLKPGDLMFMVAQDGNMVARKIDLTRVGEEMHAH